MYTHAVYIYICTAIEPKRVAVSLLIDVYYRYNDYNL